MWLTYFTYESTALKEMNKSVLKKTVFLFDFMDSTFLYIIFSFFVKKYIHFRLE